MHLSELLVLPLAAAVLITATTALADDAATPAHDRIAPSQTEAPGSWRHIDPTWADVVQVKTRRFTFGAREVVRMTPMLPSPFGPIAVEGADAVITHTAGKVVATKLGAPLAIRGQFKINAREATLAAVRHMGNSVLRPQQIGDQTNLAHPIWLASSAGLRPAWRVRVPTWSARDLSDVWVDADSGAIVRQAKSAKFANAPRSTGAQR